MKKIVLILPYFGKWPVWFDAFLVSVAANPTVHWFCPTDCELPKEYPENIRFYSISLIDLNQKVNTVVDCNVPLTPRKFCDLKPAYGAIFKDEIKNYDFWGFCDMDIIWGDIRKFITEDLLQHYDVISSRREAISGHFNLFRNTPELLEYYKTVPNYRFLFEQSQLMRFDEEKLTNHIKHEAAAGRLYFNVYWDKILCNQERGRDSHQEYYLERWFWDNGRMINTQTGEEIMYLHFINWKRTMKKCEIRYSDQPDRFYISYSKIHFQPHTTLQKMWNNFTNLFDGYYVRLKKNNFKRKVKKGKNIFKIYKWGK